MNATSHKPPLAEAAALIEAAQRRRQGALSEYEAKRLLGLYGIAVTREMLAADAAAAAAAAARLGFPVALKGCHWTLQHKTEADMIRLGLVDAAAVAAACAELAPRLPEGGEWLVQEMVSGKREVMLGLARDPQFGACISLGIGGIFAEAVGDVVFRIAPFDALEAEAMIDELRLGSLLGPFRGLPPADRSALVRALLALSDIAQAFPAIREIDINPMIIAGAQPVAIDALVILQP